MLGVKDVRGAIGRLRRLRSWQALQEALMGSLVIEIEDWQSVTSYDSTNGSESDAKFGVTKSLFWSEVAKLSPTQAKQLLYFWTAEAAPAGGLKHLGKKMKLKIDLRPRSRAPKAETCFFKMTIPATDTAEDMATVLQWGIGQWRDWGFS